jgi:hypothetical protein
MPITTGTATISDNRILPILVTSPILISHRPNTLQISILFILFHASHAFVGLHIRVHFDNFSAKWDEWYSGKDFNDGRLSYVYHHSVRKLKISDLIVLHRRQMTDNSASNQSESRRSDRHSSDKSNQAAANNYELVGVPFILQCESFRSCTHVYGHIVEQAMRYASIDEVAATD